MTLLSIALVFLSAFFHALRNMFTVDRQKPIPMEKGVDSK